MSTKAERLAKYIEAIDSYIKHQMVRRTEDEKISFREKQIAMYDDKLERDIEKLKHALARSLGDFKSKGGITW